ncbi:hypothetical protein QQZ08_002096 [Neonectria magnoliae]|uniref:NodB homology domain-containing protein n=1 Tax=Neonectria magnoliae TaxID=2732573 RepID=A0ABR1ICJ8_9HYPO
MSSIKILVSIDFDAVSGWLGTGSHPDNTLSDYACGIFAGQVGVPRMLRLFKRLGIADKMTWFIPGHSMESFPDETAAIIKSGAEIGLHGYCHEGAYQLTEGQEREVFAKCIEVAERLTGKKPRGYRAPLYQVRESTIRILEDEGFLYDSSLAAHDSQIYRLPHRGGTPMKAPEYKAESSAYDWMHPTVFSRQEKGKVLEIPCNWYMEDATPMMVLPHAANSHGYVDARVIENNWKERFEFLVQERDDLRRDEATEALTVFPLCLHPDTCGHPHVLRMLERFLVWIQSKGDDVEFLTYTEAAERSKV